MTTSSWYRSTYFSMKGNREYTRAGYEAAAARFDPLEMDVDCNGRRILITGGNKGLGLSAAHSLAKKGAILHLVCRDMEAANTARSSIITDTGNDKIHLHELDLSQPRQVLQFCSEFVSRHQELHVLINNAGDMVHERRVDQDGIEYNFAVNTLAPHLLTVGLLPLLQGSEDSRVITVSSAGMLTVRLDPRDLMFQKMEPFNGRLAYSQTKRQQVVLTLSYAQLYDKVQFSAMHPGWADTLSVRRALPDFYETMKDKMRTPDQGADTIVWLAISQRARTYTSGLFFQDRETVATHLPLAWTRCTMNDEKIFLENLQEITNKLQQPRQTQEQHQQINETNPSGDGQNSDLKEPHEQNQELDAQTAGQEFTNPETIVNDVDNVTHESPMSSTTAGAETAEQERTISETIDNEVGNVISDSPVQITVSAPDGAEQVCTISENTENDADKVINDFPVDSTNTVQETTEQERTLSENTENDVDKVINDFPVDSTNTVQETTEQERTISENTENDVENVTCDSSEPSNNADAHQNSNGVNHDYVQDKNSDESTVSTITNNLQSTKIEETSKESTVS